MGNVPPSALRQPPPPRRCLLIDSNKVHAPATSKAEGDISRVRSRPFYFRRCKKANPLNLMIESLPDELLMEILLCLSADDICDNARLVCRRWRNLIHTDAFVREQLQRASSGLLLMPLEDACERRSPIIVTATTQGRVETSKLSCKFPILCSCNGLALCFRIDRPEDSPFIFNPATKCAFKLPRLPKILDVELIYRLGMAYVAASMAYKVVGTYHSHKSGITHCIILTVGVDKTWRHVALEGLSPEARSLSNQLLIPLITRCFVHWVSETLVVSLNVETEIFTATPTPDYQERKYTYRCVSTGEHLSLFIYCGDNWSWEVWEMKPETWEWRKMLPKINLEAHKRKIQHLGSQDDNVFVSPVGWVRYPEVLAFSFTRKGHYCIIYNLVTEEFESIELSTATNYICAVQHRNTLVWSKKC